MSTTTEAERDAFLDYLQRDVPPENRETMRRIAMRSIEAGDINTVTAAAWAAWQARAGLAALQQLADAKQVDDGALPATMLPVHMEWYSLCELAPHAHKIVISGALAEAIVRTVAAPPAASGGEPVVWVSPEQAAAHQDRAPGEGGNYLPARKSMDGKFTMPLYAAARSKGGDSA